MKDAAIIAPHFSDPDKAREFLEAKRWPDGPICPHCGVIGEAYRIEPDLSNKKAQVHARKGVWKCAGCREQFTVTVGTIMEDSHIPLNKWLFAFHLLCSSKKGMSAHQLHRMLGVTYKSAWFMAHRIRYAMTQEPLSSKLGQRGGNVECDETYVGGRERGKRGMPGPDSKKTPVMALVERGGNVRSMAMERVTVKNIKPVFEEFVSKEAVLHTDEATVYYFMKDQVAEHHTINHSKEEYVRNELGRVVTTNTVEGFFSLVKRSVYGTYHHWSREHLHRYLTEIDFRYNARHVSDVERRDLAIKQVGGKRLLYRDSCGRKKETNELPF